MPIVTNVEFGLKKDIPETPENLHIESAKRMQDATISLLHPQAQQECYGFNRRTRIHEWLRQRMASLGITAKDRGKLTLNPWNVTHGLGLQSVSIGVLRPTGKGDFEDLLLDDEWKHPTLGVLAPKIFNNGYRRKKMAEARFQVDNGKGEKITALSAGLKMDGEDSGEIADLPIGGEPLLVTGPNAVRTYLKMEDAPPDRIRKIVHSGVYACCFVTMGQNNA